MSSVEATKRDARGPNRAAHGDYHRLFRHEPAATMATRSLRNVVCHWLDGANHRGHVGVL